MSAATRLTDELVWPWTHSLPERAQTWPTPTGQRTRPARWYGTPDEYRAFFQQVLHEQGPDALAVVYNDAPRSPDAHLTRWYCSGLPMHTTGQSAQHQGQTIHFYFLPAHAALQALDLGLVNCRAPTDL